jgi:hypothetical protein
MENLTTGRTKKSQHQGFYMGGGASGEGFQVIAAFQERDDAALTIRIGHRAQVPRYPDEILHFQP